MKYKRPPEIFTLGQIARRIHESFEVYDIMKEFADTFDNGSRQNDENDVRDVS